MYYSGGRSCGSEGGEKGVDTLERDKLLRSARLPGPGKGLWTVEVSAEVYTVYTVLYGFTMFPHRLVTSIHNTTGLYAVRSVLCTACYGFTALWYASAAVCCTRFLALRQSVDVPEKTIVSMVDCRCH